MTTEVGLIQLQTLSGIAEAIRSKTDSSESVTPSEMAQAIRSISGSAGNIFGIPLEAFTGVVVNGTLTASTKPFQVNTGNEVHTIPTDFWNSKFQSSKVTEVSLPAVTSVGIRGLLRLCYLCPNVTSVSIPALENISAEEALRAVASECPSLTSINLQSLKTVSATQAMMNLCYSDTSLQQVSFPALTSIAGTHCCQTAFYGCTALVTAAFPVLESVSNGTSTNQGALENTFEGCTSLQSVDFSSLETISGRGTLWRCFLRCSSLTSVDFSSLKTINNGYAPLGQMFSGCTNLTSVSFPSLISVKNDSFAEFAYGSSLTEIHFRTDMQATIQALSGYSSCFGKGAGTITIYFDL